MNIAIPFPLRWWTVIIRCPVRGDLALQVPSWSRQTACQAVLRDYPAPVTVIGSKAVAGPLVLNPMPDYGWPRID